MSKSILLAVVAVLCMGLALLAGCADSSSASYDFGSGSVETRGNAITIKLKGNPTTGFEWSSEISGNALTSVSEEYESDNEGGNVCGAGGVYTYVYKGRGEGLTTIIFSYRRPWEDASPQDTFEVAVKTDKEGNIISTSVTSEGKLLGAS